LNSQSTSKVSRVLALQCATTPNSYFTFFIEDSTIC
jgi:hypothetical protein